jgi:hypothetical protein
MPFISKYQVSENYGGVLMSGITSKIFNAQIIFEYHGKTYTIDNRKSLWTDTSDRILNKYRNLLKEKIKLAKGENATKTFTKLAEGHQNGSGIEYVFLTPMIEHYFHNLVFIQESFKQAILDLYLFKREFINKINLTDRAIIDIAWVAKQKGIYLLKDTFDLEFAEKIDRELETYVSKYLNRNDQINEACIAEFIIPIKQYYHLPNIENFQNIIFQADKLSRKYMDKDWKKLLGIINSFNHNLGETLFISAEKVLNNQRKTFEKVTLAK